MEILIGVTKTTKWSEGEEWEWKKPFQELKKSVIRIEDKWHVVLTVDEGEIEEIYAMCDGRHKVETLMNKEEKTELWADKTDHLSARPDDE